MVILRRSSFILLSILCSCALFRPDEPDAVDVQLHSYFTDHAVFQRGEPIPVYGTAGPGGWLKVSLGNSVKWANAGADGAWRVTFPPLHAGGPYALMVESAGGELLKLQDVLIGDVWICSGQSNMEWPVSRSANADYEIAAAKYPDIRLLTLPRKSSADPVDSFDSEWVRCSPESVGDFSAVGYFFGRELHTVFDVPVGLVNSSWGGTIAEAWTPAAALESEPLLAPMMDKFKKQAETYPERLEEYEKRLETVDSGGRKKTKYHIDGGNGGEAMGWARPEFDDSAWSSARLPGYWENVTDYKMDGAVWFRRWVEIPASWKGKEIRVSLGAIDDFDTSYLDGEIIGSTGSETENAWFVPRNYKVSGDRIEGGKALIAVRVFDHFGSGGFAGREDEMFIACGSEKTPLGGEWKYKVEFALDPLALDQSRKRIRPIPPDSPKFPATLYNAMVNPLVRSPVRGVVWYQGESNASRARQYRTLMKTLIKSWRGAWGDSDLPFIMVQLANFGKSAGTAADSAWAELREAQMMALELSNTGLATAIDLGEGKNIHPKNKEDVGKRLALCAFKISYGADNIVYTGPIYNSMELKGARIEIAFDHIGSGLVSKDGKALRHFAVASEDGEFVPAEAEIKGDRVVVWSPGIKRPAAVRYAWADNPENLNLYNEEGLPALPFRTDTDSGKAEMRNGN